MEKLLTVLKVGGIVDGHGRNRREPSVIVIQEGKIQAIGPPNHDDLPQGPNVTSLDFSDATALPGLIDVHTHLVLPGDHTPLDVALAHDDGILLLQASENAKRALAAGVTTVADMGARNRVAFTLRQAIDRGLITGPRLVVCGRPLTRTGGHCWFFNGEADGADAIRQTVRQLLKEGADVIKVIATGGGTPGTDPFRPSYRLDELVAARQEAHALGKKTAIHCSASAGMNLALTAEFDTIFHAHFYDPDGVLRYQPRLAQRLADSGAYVNPTLQVNRARLLHLEARVNRLDAGEQRELAQRRARYAGQTENVAKLIDLGVKMAAGSDAGWGPNPFGDLVSELEAMVEVGLSAADALVAATRHAADALGIGKKVGTIEVGKQADILLVRGDPSRDIGALRNIRGILLGGRPTSRPS